VANYVAAWDGNAWSALGSGMDNDVDALAVSGTTLYAGGDFSTAGGVAANCVAAWDGKRVVGPRLRDRWGLFWRNWPLCLCAGG